MTNPAKRERAGRDLVAVRPDGWALDPPSYDPATGRWSITARDMRPGRGRAPETVTGNGENEMAAAAD
jgi:hypothetical protein